MKAKSTKRKLALLALDVLIFMSAYYVMAIVDSKIYNIFSRYYYVKLVSYVITLISIRMLFQVYRSIWRYANYVTYSKLIVADAISVITFFILGKIFPILGFPTESLVIFTTVNALATLCFRFIYQMAYAYHKKKIDEQNDNVDSKLNKINIAIVGAGNVGASLVETLQRNPKAHYNPYCFIDSDETKVGNMIGGILVYHDDDKIVDILKTMPVQEIIIAIADLDSEQKLRFYSKYKQTNCKVKIYDYPTADNLNIKGRIREFKIEDLLFRKTLKFNTQAAKSFYNGKVVMVTGGGGSIGSEVCRQVAKQNPAKLVILDIYENNAYEIQQELIRKYKDTLNLEVYIASVRDLKRLDEIFAKVKPNIVFHAAAHKHVPLMENNSCEAIKNNVLGTYNTANMAEKYGAQNFLLISTDKAVNPTNIMGASKRLCEMIIQCRTESLTKFTAVRFGNVLGSNGSVIPLFKRQIENGGPITITDKRIIRYFMTIPEATQLVLEAGAMAKNGELFVLDMGSPVKILDLAENMIRLSGLVPYEDIDIVEIGLRPGEKLYEELLMDSEELDKTENEMIFIERDKPYTRKEIEEKLDILKEALEKGDNKDIKQAIKQTVPTYISSKKANTKLDEIIKEEMALTSIDSKTGEKKTS